MILPVRLICEKDYGLKKITL